MVQKNHLTEFREKKYQSEWIKGLIFLSLKITLFSKLLASFKRVKNNKRVGIIFLVKKRISLKITKCRGFDVSNLKTDVSLSIK